MPLKKGCEGEREVTALHWESLGIGQHSSWRTPITHSVLTRSGMSLNTESGIQFACEMAHELLIKWEALTCYMGQPVSQCQSVRQSDEVWHGRVSVWSETRVSGEFSNTTRAIKGFCRIPPQEDKGALIHHELPYHSIEANRWQACQQFWHVSVSALHTGRAEALGMMKSPRNPLSYLSCGDSEGTKRVCPSTIPSHLFN